MRFKIRGRYWGLGKDFDILDESEDCVFHAAGTFLSLGHKLSLQDACGIELAYIAQKVLSLRTRYFIYRCGVQFAEVTKEFSWIKSRFLVDTSSADNYTVEGSFWGREFILARGNRHVASASRPFFSLRACFEVDIVEGEDIVAILAMCLVIIHVLRDEETVVA